ncbi:MAG: hypothetical protein JWM44_3825 [Bacilli bacterium]|nr:hypothetical protein [Bacilli bacterium]
MLNIQKRHQLEYHHSKGFDEMFVASGQVRDHYNGVQQRLLGMSVEELNGRNASMQSHLVKQGVTFTLYNDHQSEPSERLIPFDMIPRIVSGNEWSVLEKGLKQRTKALNLFLWDIYHKQNILYDGIVPRKMVVTNRYFRPEMMDMNIPHGVYTPLSGIDLIRDGVGDFFVLEDNLRTPSGLSYLYKNRQLTMHLFPELYFDYQVRDIDRGLNDLLSCLRSIAPGCKKVPVVALLTPGSGNSAYYEHTFLAQEMGILLVEGRDLVVMDHKVYMRSITGLQQIDVIYRRLDDDFLDPLAFRADSMLGVAGLMNAYRMGNVAIANAPGTGVADDKAIYAYVPEMIRYYLNEEPLLNNVPTYILSREAEREYVLAHLAELVVKETSLSGGYGMLIGPCASEQEIAEFADKIRQDPANYIAQPTIQLSTAPTFIDGQLQPRHIDLRAFVTYGSDMQIIAGGLTRVALKEGSLVVNSSQGGGSKDTWVLS